MLNQPRPIKFQTIVELLKKRFVFFILGTVFSSMGIMTLIIFLILPSTDDDTPEVDYDNVNNKGALATATITAIDAQENITINGKHPSIISYRYTVEGTTVVSKFKTLSPQQVNRLEVGDTIEIKYLNRASIIPSLPLFSFPYYTLYSIPGVLLSAGILFLSILIFKTHREIQLYKFGTIANATVVSMTYKRGSPRSRMAEQIRLHYQFTTIDGKTFLADDTTRDMSLAQTLKQNDTIKVFISSENPPKSILIPNLEAVRNGWIIA